MKSQGEIEAAVCDAVSRFQQEFMGRGPRNVHAHLIDNRLFVHMAGRGDGSESGADLLKQLRSRLVTAGRSVLESLVREASGASPVNLHHDISPVTGEEVIVITLAAAPQCRDRKKR